MSEEAPWEADPLVKSASQNDVRKVDQGIEEKQAYTKMLTGKSTKDKNFNLGLFRTSHEQLTEERSELTLANLNELEAELKRTKDPKARKVLTEELERMSTSFANLVGTK